MTEQPNAFETRLAALFDGYASGAPVGVNAPALAREIATHDRRVVEILGRTFVRPRWLVPAVLVLLLAALAAVVFVGGRLLESRPLPYRGVFTARPDMATARHAPLALTLPDGRILVAGSQDGGPEAATAELYDLATGESQSVVGMAPLGQSMGVVTADGRAYVVAFSSNMTASWSYVFDSTANEFRRIPIETFANAPVYGVRPSMALLQDGRLLIAGGQADVYKISVRDEAVLFDFRSEEFMPTGSMLLNRLGHSMTTLADGRVLVAGGIQVVGQHSLGGPEGRAMPTDTAELYDPTTGSFSAAGTMVGVTGDTVASLLADGRVAVFQVVRAEAGAPDPAGPFGVQIYDPATNAFTDGGTTEWPPSTATPLRDGRVLLTGKMFVGFNYAGPGTYFDRTEAWAAVYDPADRSLMDLATPPAVSFGVAPLEDGRVALIGGTAHPPLDENGNTTGESFPVPWVRIFE